MLSKHNYCKHPSNFKHNKRSFDVIKTRQKLIDLNSKKCPDKTHLESFLCNGKPPGRDDHESTRTRGDIDATNAAHYVADVHRTPQTPTSNWWKHGLNKRTRKASRDDVLCWGKRRRRCTQINNGAASFTAGKSRRHAFFLLQREADCYCGCLLQSIIN